MTATAFAALSGWDWITYLALVAGGLVLLRRQTVHARRRHARCVRRVRRPGCRI